MQPKFHQNFAGTPHRPVHWQCTPNRGDTLVFVTAAALAMSVACASAQDTTVIKKDNDAGASTTIVKKHDEAPPFVAAPRTEKKVIIHKDRHDDD